MFKLKNIVLIAIGIVALGFIELYISYEWLTVNKIELEFKKIHSSINIVILSDLHDHSFGDDNIKLLSKIREQKPDAIYILGDMLNEDSDCPEQLYAFLRKLTKEYDVYYAMGNHEYEYLKNVDNQLMSKIAETGAVILEKEYQDIEINNQKLRLGGLYDYAFALDDENTTNPKTMDPEVYKYLIEFQESDAYKIMLSHRPEAFVLGEASKTWDIDLVISGHAHGGQVVLPFLGGLYAPDQGLFPEYIHGLYKKDKLNILITSGLGSQRETLPRWNNVPEILLLTLQPQE